MGLILGSSSLAFPTSSDGPPMTMDAAPKENSPKGKSLDELASFIMPAKVVDAAPEIRSTAKRQIVQYGPFEIPAYKARSSFTSNKLH